MSKLITLTNLTDSIVEVGDGVIPAKGTLEVDALSEAARLAFNASKISVTLNAAPTGLTMGLNTPVITSTTGTPVAIANKAVTVGAITSTAEAANAIATLIGVIAVMRADMIRLAGMVEAGHTALLQNSIQKQ